METHEEQKKLELLKKRIDVAAGRHKAELVLKNCKVVNVFTQEIVEGDVAICDGLIAAIGKYDGLEEVDINGKFVAPAFIDAHVHIESSMVTPSQFARAVVPSGTLTVIADPHEIANVCGADGIRFMLADCNDLPLDIKIMAPSCVPAVSFESTGAVLDEKEISALLSQNDAYGLGELMSYPNVCTADEAVLKKIVAADGKIIDGHAPRLCGCDLAAYAASGAKTDHECATVSEMVEKSRLGMYILVRNGSACKEVKHLVKGINEKNFRRFVFCTDDRHPNEIINEGHINSAMRLAVENGLDPLIAVTMATLNAAECYSLKGKGAIAPNYKADIVVLDDLKNFNVSKVYKAGKLVAKDGKALFAGRIASETKVLFTVKLKPITEDSLKLRLNSEVATVIGLTKDSIVTTKHKRIVRLDKNGCFEHVKGIDVCKAAVIERHKAKDEIGLGLIEGLGIQNGAIAQTVCHDAHNIVVAGDNDGDIVVAVKKLSVSGGGIVLAHNGKVLNMLNLPIAGLLSDKPLEEINIEMETITKQAYDILNVNKEINPFMILGFLGLPVIPALRLTTKGLFDVEAFSFV